MAFQSKMLTDTSIKQYENKNILSNFGILIKLFLKYFSSWSWYIKTNKIELMLSIKIIKSIKNKLF